MATGFTPLLSLFFGARGRLSGADGLPPRSRFAIGVFSCGEGAGLGFMARLTGGNSNLPVSHAPGRVTRRWRHRRWNCALTRSSLRPRIWVPWSCLAGMDIQVIMQQGIRLP